jgi:hypothetical protein
MLRVVLFDVNATLTDTSAIGEVWGRPQLGDRVLGQAVCTAMVDALLGGGGGMFRDHLRAALEVVVGEAGLDLERVEQALAIAAALPARPGPGRRSRCCAKLSFVWRVDELRCDWWAAHA